jgi:hypothetical protein
MVPLFLRDETRGVYAASFALPANATLSPTGSDRSMLGALISDMRIN